MIFILNASGRLNKINTIIQTVFFSIIFSVIFSIEKCILHFAATSFLYIIFRSATCTTWTHSHVELLRCLFKLCINPYAKVRLNAQTRFFRVLDSFGGLISRCIKDFFVEKLQEGVPHDEYKVNYNY